MVYHYFFITFSLKVVHSLFSTINLSRFTFEQFGAKQISRSIWITRMIKWRYLNGNGELRGAMT